MLGDGELGPAVRERVAETGLADRVILHGDQTAIAPWYAACDAVLLTSAFEGLPYVAYEAMAMATPLVAPRLPGLAELVTPETGVLVAPRDDVSGYTAAIAALAQDPERRRALGRAGRERALEGLSLRRMAAEHEALYDELLARRAVAGGNPAAGASGNGTGPLRSGVARPAVTGALRGRRPGDRPLVSVVIPCFNHGWYLEQCLRSIAEQEYRPLEVIVVDDGSTDPETLERLARIDREGGATVLRLDENRGPSAARNVAMEAATGRYVLPVDADNLLLPGAIATLVDQLSGAGERVGFIYPNLQYFGNRTDYFEAPSYNLHSLLQHNYCDTSSLIDREILDRGFRYPEDVVLGHEDWDLVLSLAEHGIYGEAANAKTLLYRKHGFTRSDLVNDAGEPFRDVVADRHPGLFDSDARARIKAEWNPALSVIAIDALDERVDNALPELVGDAVVQSCADFELILRTADDIAPGPLGPRLRRIPAALAGSRAQALAHGLEISRGRWVLALYGPPAEMLADPGMVEKVLRILATGVDGLAFADAGPAAALSWRPCDCSTRSVPGRRGWERCAGRPSVRMLPHRAWRSIPRTRSTWWRAGSPGTRGSSGVSCRAITCLSGPGTTGRTARRLSSGPWTARPISAVLVLRGRATPIPAALLRSSPTAPSASRPGCAPTGAGSRPRRACSAAIATWRPGFTATRT